MADKVYQFKLTGDMDLFMHQDDVEAADELDRERKQMDQRERVRGDDRSPAWTWMTYTYNDGDKVKMPSANIMAALAKGGAKVQLTSKITCKTISQSGICPLDEYYTFGLGLEKGKPVEVSWDDVIALRAKPFADQKRAIQAMGFKLDVRRATIGMSKHVRVRPRFKAGWVVVGKFLLVDPLLTSQLLQQIFLEAGKCGLGDWRPSAPKKPGPFGRFTAELQAM